MSYSYGSLSLRVRYAVVAFCAVIGMGGISADTSAAIPGQLTIQNASPFVLTFRVGCSLSKIVNKSVQIASARVPVRPGRTAPGALASTQGDVAVFVPLRAFADAGRELGRRNSSARVLRIMRSA